MKAWLKNSGLKFITISSLILGFGLYSLETHADNASKVDPLEIRIETSSNRVTYSFSNDRTLTPEFQSLNPEAQKQFFEIREFYLRAVAKLLTKKPVGWILTRPDWFKKQMKKIGLMKADGTERTIEPEDTIQYWLDSNKILSENWPANTIRVREKSAIQRYLSVVDDLIWEDAKNISETTDTGFLFIGQAQSGFQLGKFGLFLGGGIAIDMTRNAETGDLDFALSIHGETGDRNPIKNLSSALEILNLRSEFGVQHKKPTMSESRYRSGKGWYILGAPVHILYHGDRIARLGHVGPDVGVLTMMVSAATATGTLGYFFHHFPMAGELFQMAHMAWGHVLSDAVIRVLAVPLFIYQHFFTLQTKWAEYTLFRFSIKSDKPIPKTESAVCDQVLNF